MGAICCGGTRLPIPPEPYTAQQSEYRVLRLSCERVQQVVASKLSEKEIQELSTTELEAVFEDAIHLQIRNLVDKGWMTLAIGASLLPAGYRLLIGRQLQEPDSDSHHQPRFCAETIINSGDAERFCLEAQRLIQLKTETGWHLHHITCKGLTFVFQEDSEEYPARDVRLVRNAEAGMDVNFVAVFQDLRERALLGWRFVGNVLNAISVFVMDPEVVHEEFQQVQLPESTERISLLIGQVVDDWASKGWVVVCVVNRVRKKFVISNKYGVQQGNVSHQNCIIFSRRKADNELGPDLVRAAAAAAAAAAASGDSSPVRRLSRQHSRSIVSMSIAGATGRSGAAGDILTSVNGAMVHSNGIDGDGLDSDDEDIGASLGSNNVGAVSNSRNSFSARRSSPMKRLRTFSLSSSRRDPDEDDGLAGVASHPAPSPGSIPTGHLLRRKSSKYFVEGEGDVVNALLLAQEEEQIAASPMEDTIDGALISPLFRAGGVGQQSPLVLAQQQLDDSPEAMLNGRKLDTSPLQDVATLMERKTNSNAQKGMAILDEDFGNELGGPQSGAQADDNANSRSMQSGRTDGYSDMVQRLSMAATAAATVDDN